MVFMRFRPAWAYIEGIREFGRFFCVTTFGTIPLAERARVVLQEALENAVKYSSKADDSELELLIQTDGGDPDQFLDLKATSFKARRDTQVGALPHSSRRSGAGLPRGHPPCIELRPDTATRLGLARIRYEGAVELSLHEQEGGRIRLTATGKL